MPQQLESLSIDKALRDILEHYFDLLDGAEPATGLYDSVINIVEKILIEQTLNFTHNNQLRAANILGINRNTLRKKIQNLYQNDK